MVSSKSFPFAFPLMALSLILIGLYGSGWRSLACTEEERIGLMNLKTAFNLTDEFTFDQWHGNRTSDCCRWVGVTCSNISMRVTELQLDGEHPGYLWPWFLNASLFLPFQELESLDLSDNTITAFTGTLRLKNLRVLRLNYNELTQVPSLDKLPSLKEVYLRDNYLKNLSYLEGSKLEVLDVSGTYLPGESLSIIWNITSLEVLSIIESGLSISIFPGLCQLLRLKEFNAVDNDLIGSISPCLQNLTSLFAIDLTDNHFGGNIPSSVFHSLRSLQYISLSGNAFNGSFSLAAVNNNSRLIAFELVNNYYSLSIMTESPLYSPSSQLKAFRLSHCTINEPHGVIPTFLKGHYDLGFLELSHINMGGDFPSWLLENNTKLEVLMLTNNALSGSFALNSSPSKNVDMEWIDISSNYIHGELPDSIGTFLPHLFFFNTSNNCMQGGIPSSLGDMKSLSLLDLSSNNFTGEIPQLLLNGCEDLAVLKLSDNKLHGSVLPRIAKLTQLQSLYLDNNQFTGKICPGLLKSSNLQILDTSNNLLSGAIPSWIGDFARLAYLSLSNNSFKGPLPLSLCKLNLELLDLSSNDFGPTIPSCLNVPVLRYLSLENNHLTGPFPMVLNGASSMFMLDLGNNRLSGILPPWIGSLSSLRALLLKGNNFNGPVTHHLCRLKSISIMDLSYNKLSGSIPSCLSNLSFGNPMEFRAFSRLGSVGWSVGTRYMPTYKVLHNFTYFVGDTYVKNQMVEVKFLSKSRYESYWGDILELMSGLDLSCNNLSGSIPPEIGSLIDLHVLNLSHNYLTGPIPMTLSELKDIESLDLSYNRLSGSIPWQLIELYRLSVFSVAHNNLSGLTPEMKSQFATFGKKSYDGNPFLCGPPLESCSNPSPPMPPYPNEEEEEDHSLRDAFRWSFTGSYAVTFLGSVAFFFLNSYYSSLIFNFCCRHILWIYYRLTGCV